MSAHKGVGRDEAKLAAAAERVFDAMPDPPVAYAVPFAHEKACGLVLRWAAKGVGFGEITIAIDKVQGAAPTVARVDAEEMGWEFVGKMLMALGDGADQLHKARQHDVALRLLDPVSPDETLVGAVNNLRQTAASAVGNTEVLEARLRRCLRALRAGVDLLDPPETATGPRRGPVRDWTAGASRVLAECGVGVDLDVDNGNEGGGE